MEGAYRMLRIVSVVLITFILAGFSAGPDPEPVSKGFVSVFDNKQKRADRHFANFEYKSAIQLYNKLVEKGKADDLVKLRLAESYLKVNDPENAEKWYAEVIHSEQVTPQHQMQYAHILLSNGKYQQAREVIEAYEFADSDNRSQAIINTLDMLEVLYQDSSYYKMDPVPDNKPGYSDFSPVPFKDGIVFVSSRHNKGPKFKWDETPFLDLYYTESDIASAVPFSNTLNSKYHEGPIAFYDSYQQAIFTRSNFHNKQLGMTEQGINNLRLYSASWNDSENEWDNIQPINFMIANYSYGHPTVSADNSKLYFVSDMPGGFGGTDLYVSERTEMGWSEPRNLGEVINTSGNEMYPYIDAEGNLYFSSNGHGGLGGLDMYQINLESGSTALRNMGYPLNTTADDFGFSLSKTGKMAYVSSNRDGVDNIFKVDIQAPDLEMVLADNTINDGEAPEIFDQLEPVATTELSTIPLDEEQLEEMELSTINAAVMDDNNNLLADADLKLLVNGEHKETLKSDENGQISVQVPADQEYTLIAAKEGFEDRVISLPASTLGQQEDLLIILNESALDSPVEDMPITELDPLAVSGDAWDQNEFDGEERPEIDGVALAEVPQLKEAANSEESDSDELSTTQLDPLSVSDNVLEDSGLKQDNRPEINGVALTALPLTAGAVATSSEETSDEESPSYEETTTVAQESSPFEESQTTELDPLAVSGDAWDQNEFDGEERPEINGVTLAEVPQLNEAAVLEETDSDELSTTQLDPLFVSDNALEDSGLKQDNRPEINRVALTALPLTASAVATSSEETSYEESPFYEETTTVAQESSPFDETTTTELDPLAVSDDAWDQSEFDGGVRPEINGVALAEVPQLDEPVGSEEPDSDELSTTQLDPLSVSDNVLEDSGLKQNQRPEINGVALSALPLAASATAANSEESSTKELPSYEDTSITNQESASSEETPTTTELDPLAVSDDPWDQSEFDGRERPEVNGVALADVPELDEPVSSEEPDSDALSTTQLDPLAVSDGAWDQSEFNGMEQPAINGVALTKAPQEQDQWNSLTEESSSFGEDLFAVDTESNKPISEEANSGILSVEGADEEVEASKVDSPELINNNAWEEETTGADSRRPGESLKPENIQTEPGPYDDPDKSTRRLISTQAIDAINGNKLADTELKLFVANPDASLDYELRDGVLTFEALPEEEYIIVASHDNYQDQFITLSGADLLAEESDYLNLELDRLTDATDRKRDGKATKFKAVVWDQQSGEMIEDAAVKFFVDGKAVESEFSKENGKTVFKAPKGSDYMMLVSRDGYQDLIYHLPGVPGENTDVDLAMLPAEEIPSDSPYQLLALKGQAFDEFSGADLDGVTFKIFENGNLIETTDHLNDLEVDPESDYQILAEKEGFQEQLITIEPNQLDGSEPATFNFALAREVVSESDGSPVYADENINGITPLSAKILDIEKEQPLSEATVVVFADDQIQQKVTTWTNGTVAINAVPGKDYRLLVQRAGYTDQLISLGQISEADQQVEVAMVPDAIKTVRQSGIDLDNADLLVLAGPTGEGQQYLSTGNQLYRYEVKNDNHYLINDQETILLKERTRSLGSKVTTRQDTDQYMLRAEDQFLYDQLSADEKAKVDKIATLISEEKLQDNPDLNIYYNNLPEEYRALAQSLAIEKQRYNSSTDYPADAVSTSEQTLNQLLAEKHMRIANTFNVNNIYYDFDKDEIREDAAIELDKLIDILQSNQNIKVSMFSHADSRGSSTYNSTLSRQRGNSAINYLVERGISKDRLSMEAKGESQLVNSCVDSIKCSEQAHQLNRRTEFILST